jgi:TonB family protein
MDALFLYLLKSGISLALLYAVYWFLLRKETFFRLNRLFLVSAVLFSAIFPVLSFTWFVSGDSQATYLVVLDAVMINSARVEHTLSQNMSAFQYIVLAWFAGVAIFTLRFLFQLLQLFWMVFKYGVTTQDGLRIVFVDRNYAPFSFFNLIFLQRNTLNHDNIQKIISHEQVHIRQKHTIDLVLIELMTILQWFNPVIWLYRMSIKSVHEYLADEGALRSGFNPVDYQQVLIGQTMGFRVNDLTNNFNHSLLTKRFIMMTKNKSKRLAKLKVLLAAPVALMLILAFTLSPAVQTLAQVESKPQQPEVEKPRPQQEPEEIFNVVDEMPAFPGGMEAFMEYLTKNITYPATAKEEGLEGTVFISFVVEKDGSITNVTLLRGFYKACDEEALRVVRNMPAWEPGKELGQTVRTRFNIPIRFTLNTTNDENE